MNRTVNRTPENILWLHPSLPEGDSMLNLICKTFAPNLPEEWADATQVLVTNGMAYNEFSGRSYYVPANRTGPQTTLYEKSRELALSAYYGGFLADADIIITTTELTSMLSYFLDFEGGIRKGIRLRPRPVITFWPKVPEASDSLFSLDDLGPQLFWWLLGSHPAMWSFNLDNDLESKLARDYLLSASPKANINKIKTVTTHKWDGFISTTPKSDLVIWQGMAQQDKWYDDAIKILSIISGLGYESKAFMSGSNASDLERAETVSGKLFPMEFNLDRALYQKELEAAKVVVIASETEGYPIGYFEAIERGAIPVIKERPWMKTFLTENWPLVWKTPGEAVQMVQDAIENYKDYRSTLNECLSDRYSTNPNFADLMRHVWSSYLVGSDREFSVKRS